MSFMTPEQCRMARAALALTTKSVADGTGIGINTITRFERGGDVRLSTAQNLQTYLESAGITFIDADENGGPGVRLKK